jgi:hypothetical protein
MKKFSIFAIISAFLVLQSCKKEVPPTLVVTVVDSEGKSAPKADVHVYPKYATDGVVSKEMDKRGTTGSDGKVTFEFKYSAVLDIDVIYAKETFDSTLMTYVSDTLTGHKVVKIESKRQRSKDNTYEETVKVE